MKKFGVKTIVAIGIGSALFFLLGRFVSIPVFANTNINFQYAVLGFFSVVFGPIAGLLIGLIGHVLIDLTMGYGIWWSWVIASGLVGLVIGFICNKTDVDGGEFGGKGAVRFILATIVGNLAAWVIVAPLLDIFIYSEPMDKVFAQGGIAALINIVTTAVIGTLLLFAYAAIRPKRGSLNAE